MGGVYISLRTRGYGEHRLMHNRTFRAVIDISVMSFRAVLMENYAMYCDAC